VLLLRLGCVGTVVPTAARTTQMQGGHPQEAVVALWEVGRHLARAEAQSASKSIRARTRHACANVCPVLHARDVEQVA
jgi:beta-lactamase superfamily II metal-dependent hydrolase